MEMNKKFLYINDIRLAYHERNPEKSFILFFIHGNSTSSAVWNKQLRSNLFVDYRLLAIDLPAHGDSDACRNPNEDYNPLFTAQILAQAIKQLAGTDPYVLIGFSYGTNLIAEMLVHGLNPVGIAFTGPCVVGENYGPDKILISPESSIFFRDEFGRQEVVNFFNMHLITTDDNDILNYTNDFFAVRPLFRSSMIQKALSGNLSDEIMALQKYEIPILIVFGQLDKLININYLDEALLPLWRNAILKLPDTGHFIQTDQPDVLNQLILEYTSERFK